MGKYSLLFNSCSFALSPSCPAPLREGDRGGLGGAGACSQPQPHTDPAFMQTFTTFKLTSEEKKIKLFYKAYIKQRNIFKGFYTFGFAELVILGTHDSLYTAYLALLQLNKCKTQRHRRTSNSRYTHE